MQQSAKYFLLVLAVGLCGLHACSNSKAQRIKRSFVGQSIGPRPLIPKGLNPFGHTPVCRANRETQRQERNLSKANGSQLPVILVANPTQLSQTATTMVVRLHQHFALAHAPPKPLVQQPPPLLATFMLAPIALGSYPQSLDWGKHCQALLVLWETPQSNTLSLTFVQPPGAPLQVPVREGICRFGFPTEQFDAMVSTIKALLAWRRGEAALAATHAVQADYVGRQCLQIFPSPSSPFHSPAKKRP